MANPRPVLISSLPLIYLHLAGQLELLTEMYSDLITVPEVLTEIEDEHARGGFAPALSDLPTIRVERAPRNTIAAEGRITPMNAALFSLAQSLPNSLVVVEDRNVRRAADTHRIETTGVVGILLMAKREGKLSNVSTLLPLLAEGGLKLSEKARFAIKVMAKEV